MHSIDPYFPQIAQALDMPLMQATLQKHLFLGNKSPSRILSCEIGAQRYKPGKSCVITYRLKIFKPEAQATEEQLLCGRLCAPNEGPDEFRRAKKKTLFNLPEMHSLLYLDDPEMLLWVFPNDRKLSHLPQMLDLSFLSKLFPKRLSGLELGRARRLIEIRPEVVHYLPERSCMIRYRLRLQALDSGELHSETIYGKVFPDESGEQIYKTMRQLSEQMPPGQTAEALGYDPELKALWQSEVPGQPLVAEVIGEDRYLHTMSAIARSVAAFHSAKVEGLEVFELQDVFHLLKKTVMLVEKSHARLSGEVAALVQALLRCAEAPDFFSSHKTPIHRDLKLGNMLIHEGQVGLIDMDCVCLGDPLNDVGSFIANFYLNGLYADCDEASLRARVETFCRVYAEEMPWPVSQTQLSWYISASFLYEVLRRSIRQQNPRRLAHLARYLELSASYCPGGEVHAEG